MSFSFTFVLIFCLITLGCMGATVAAIIIAVSKGMLRKVNPDVEVLQRPQKLLGWSVSERERENKRKNEMKTIHKNENEMSINV